LLVLARAGLVGSLALIAAHQADAGAAVLPAGPACGSASAGVVLAIDNAIVHEIYENELGSAEVHTDLGHITASTQLASAVASGNAKLIKAATHAIVYKPHWHIVRLRVLSTTGKVLADVGGPDIIAPLTGQITYGGKVVGSFVTSVQDDLGYRKLVNAIVGVPVEIYRDGRPLMGSVTDPPSAPPPSGPLTLAGVHYTVDAYDVAAFPSGRLRIAVLVPPPSAALARLTCPEVKLHTVTGVVKRVSIGLADAGFPFLEHTSLFVSQAATYAKGPVFVLNGTQEQAGTNELPGRSAPAPQELPASGQVAYNGSQWLVASFERFKPDRVYVLQPVRQPSGESAATGATAPR
jgi:hypothetical protein